MGDDGVAAVDDSSIVAPFITHAQIKRKNGIIERENYNKPKSEDSSQPGTTPEKEKAITEALKHFNMI